ncbi:RNA 3'-terminal phosphate cyclase [Crepidotus variabilis]|uniref:RNA 3'-terminal-phosphate cyclase (ATP) n=1 Tax=Crepidotus variabilis TaxID=179855 RepID=A0A9P6EM94_9AGAR|nr:RNA 3'-terminal phosphate cyclase [Crepidotus variabilis]
MTSKVIDGSVLEGGGQILRNAVSLSALLSKPVKIEKIRNGRKPPGLKNQHRTGLELAAQISNAQLTGAKNGSREIEFIPGQIQLPDRFHADSVTAGSITLLSQIGLPLLLFSPTAVGASKLTLLGGTNASNAPQIDYTEHIFIPFMRRFFGVENISLHIKKRGYFPKGGGEVDFKVTPLSEGQKLKSFSLMKRGKVKWIAGISHFAGLPRKIGENMVKGATSRLAQAGFVKGQIDFQGELPAEVLDERRDVPVSIPVQREPDNLTKGAGSGIVLWAELEGGGILGGSAIGSKNIDPEKVGEEAANELLKALDNQGCVDEHLQDQIIMFMALAEGKSEVRCGKDGLALHTKTAIWLAEQLTDAKFDIEEESEGTVVIRCDGIGYTSQPERERDDGDSVKKS